MVLRLSVNMLRKVMAAEGTVRLLPPIALCATPARGYRQPSHARLSGREFLVLGETFGNPVTS